MVAQGYPDCSRRARGAEKKPRRQGKIRSQSARGAMGHAGREGIYTYRGSTLSAQQQRFAVS
jgi:hypothetical protein